MTELRIPLPLLHWIDKQRGAMSRQAFILSCLYQMMNEQLMNK